MNLYGNNFFLCYFLPYLRELKQCLIMNASSLSVIEFSKHAFCINNSLDQSGRKSFIAIVRSWSFFWISDGYMTSINCTKYKKNPMQILKINTNFCNPWWCQFWYYLGHQMQFHNITKFSSYNRGCIMWDSKYLFTIHQTISTTKAYTEWCNTFLYRDTILHKHVMFLRKGATILTKKLKVSYPNLVGAQKISWI
jgi:hypothetical protein